MKSKLKIFKLMLLLCLIIVGCEKDDTEINFTYQEKINPASVDDAKSLFNLNYGQSYNGSGALQKSTNTIQVDWQSSKTKEYKETSTQDVDILYTPIYISTNANAKAFIATVDNNGITESKIFVVLYKENPFGNTGLSAYVFRYAIDGTIEIGYNLENGVQIPFDTSTTTSSLNKSNSNCDEYPSSGDFDEVQVWLEDCGGILEDVVVEAPPTPTETIDAGPSSGGGCLDCSSWPAFDSSIFNDNSTSSGTSSNVNPSVIVPNMVSADPISISIALEAPPLSQENTWLKSLPNNQQTQDLLDAIAQYLNDNKAKSPDPAFDNTNPSQIPDIKDEDVAEIMNLINFLIQQQSEQSSLELVLDILNNLNNGNILSVDDIFIFESPDTEIDSISTYLSIFNINQNVTVIINVDQPVPNVDQPNSGFDVGHSFITLEQGTKKRSFGFYPDGISKPTAPTEPGIFGDNSLTQYDVNISTIASGSQLQSIINLAVQYESGNYNLNTNNCTDFVIDVGTILDYNFGDANNTWYMGGGSNPGTLGQVLRNLISNNQASGDTTGGSSPANSN